ncbi:hypothetical protein HCU64_16470 [Methylobacterium sp. C25]|uniref:hypothetical protein n=1 Tax=Methylobacterium sp. C25 TaxID=2721622 RepID=UPI001F2265F0|nr:hypothetical protein [Methylobacterium sp. C25]MCE4225352.1 hypothetical protein [Methylobacterium sp. C25]
MAAKKKKEAVSVSFHYLSRSKESDKGDVIHTAFTSDNFNLLEDNMKKQTPIDFRDQKSVDRLRFRSEIILLNIKRENPRTIIGTFKNPYSGHAFENTHKGKIPADSVSLRPFHFLIYLSDEGRIYIAS